MDWYAFETIPSHTLIPTDLVISRLATLGKGTLQISKLVDTTRLRSLSECFSVLRFGRSEGLERPSDIEPSGRLGCDIGIVEDMRGDAVDLGHHLMVHL
jgi:hypothetical protein